MEELGGQLGLDVSNPVYSDLLDEVSDALITLLLEQFLEPVRTKVVEELLNIFLLGLFGPSNVEIHSDIQSDPDIIFSWHICDGALVPNSILGDHDTNLFVRTVEDAATWVHDSVVLTEELLHGVDSVGNIDLAVATFLVLDNCHDWDAVTVGL